MKGYSSITLAMRVAISLIIFVTVWITFNSYMDNVKNMEYANKMQNVAEYTEAQVLYSLKMLQSPDYSYLRQKIYLPDYGQYYATSIGCSGDKFLTINASMPARGINFIIKDYINCSNMNLNGTVLPGGERCIMTNRTGTVISINLVSSCGFV
jgi:hypothetical protein